ncbi:MAG: cupredoxin domain-containing protein [bacterium]
MYCHKIRNIPIYLFLVIVVILTTGILTLCKKKDPRDQFVVEGYDVEIVDHEFHPNSIDVIKGNEVVWENLGDTVHTVTSGFPEDPEHYFNSDIIKSGEEFHVRFDSLGSFVYYCQFHPDSMTGIVNVVEDTLIKKPISE